MKGVSITSKGSKRVGRSYLVRRFLAFLLFVTVLVVLFSKPLAFLAVYVARSDLHSYILLIPFVFAYLVYVHREELPSKSSRSLIGTFSLLIVGLASLGAAFGVSRFSATASPSEHIALTILAFVCFVAAGGFFFLGGEWMRSLAFPFGFLIFLVPLPDAVVSLLETASQVASADAAALFFTISGTPILRNGMVFQLPGMVIQVAQECSGIRSSLILFITSLVAAHLFLKRPWSRVVLVGFVIPLGILRNGLRIAVIGLLCVHYGPQMIHSVIHRRGGPLFFALSLLPLFLLLWLLRRRDPKRIGGHRTKSKPAKPLPDSSTGKPYSAEV